MNKKTSNVDEVLAHLRNGNRARVADWDEKEFIQYDPVKGVITETDEECNAMVFIVNSEWQLIPPRDDQKEFLVFSSRVRKTIDPETGNRSDDHCEIVDPPQTQTIKEIKEWWSDSDLGDEDKDYANLIEKLYKADSGSTITIETGAPSGWDWWQNHFVCIDSQDDWYIELH